MDDRGGIGDGVGMDSGGDMMAVGACTRMEDENCGVGLWVLNRWRRLLMVVAKVLMEATRFNCVCCLLISEPMQSQLQSQKIKKKIDVAVLITMVDCFFETLQHPALQGKVLSAITSICWFLLGWWWLILPIFLTSTLLMCWRQILILLVVLIGWIWSFKCNKLITELRIYYILF